MCVKLKKVSDINYGDHLEENIKIDIYNWYIDYTFISICTSYAHL